MTQAFAIIQANREDAQRVLKGRYMSEYCSRAEIVTIKIPTQVIFVEPTLEEAVKTCRRFNRENSTRVMHMYRAIKVY